MSDSLPIESALPASTGGAWAASEREPDSRPVVVLRPPSSVLTGLGAHLLRLPRYSDLLWTLTVHRVKVRYKQSLLGWAWALLQPLLVMLISMMLSSVTGAKVNSGGVPYSLFVYAGALPWSFFSTALGNSTNSLVGQAPLVTKIWFPREILPLSYVTAALFDFMVASLLLVALMLWYHVALTPMALVAPLLIALMAVLAFAIGVALAAVQVHYRDIGIAVPLLLQVWMFASPVAYPYSAVPVRYRWLYDLNPMAGLVEGFRRVTVQAQAPDWRLLAVSVAISVALLPACYLYFKYVDATIADRM